MELCVKNFEIDMAISFQLVLEVFFPEPYSVRSANIVCIRVVKLSYLKI